MIITLYPQDIDGTIESLFDKEEVDVLSSQNMSKNKLQDEIERRLQRLKSDCEQVNYLLQSRLPFQKVVNHRIVNVDFYQKVADINAFHKRCEEILQLDYSFILIPTGDILLGDETYTEDKKWTIAEYHQQIRRSLVEIVRDGYSVTRIHHRLAQQEEAIQNRVDVWAIEDIFLRLGKNQKNALIVIIGTPFIANYVKTNHHINIEKFIIYQKEDTEESLFEKTAELDGNREIYKVVIPHLYRNPLLKVLWCRGYHMERDVFAPAHDIFSLNRFKGYYSDVFHNEIVSESGYARFDISGSGASAYIGNNDNLTGIAYCSIHLGNQSHMEIGKDVYAEGLFLGLVYGSELFIGEKCSFDKRNTIRIGPFLSGHIGADCMFMEDIYMLAGDMHSIFDIESGKRTNYLAKDLGTEKMQILIRDHVCLQQRVTIICGCNVGSGSIIGMGTVLNKKLPKNSYIFGNPSCVVKENITWNRELFEFDESDEVGRCKCE